jgi:hypothetical protein
VTGTLRFIAQADDAVAGFQQAGRIRVFEILLHTGLLKKFSVFPAIP